VRLAVGRVASLFSRLVHLPFITRPRADLDAEHSEVPRPHEVRFEPNLLIGASRVALDVLRKKPVPPVSGGRVAALAASTPGRLARRAVASFRTVCVRSAG
jgi:hypothetical protein